MYSKSNSTSFLVKKGCADGRNIPLFGAFRRVFGLNLDIYGDVDLPILGTNLVKIGVQGAIFCNFLCRIFAQSEVNDAAESFPLPTPTNSLHLP